MFENVSAWQMPGAFALAALTGAAGLIARSTARKKLSDKERLLDQVASERDKAVTKLRSATGTWDTTRREMENTIRILDKDRANLEAQRIAAQTRGDDLNQRLEQLTQYDGRRLRHRGKRDQQLVAAQVVTSYLVSNQTMLVLQSEAVRGRPALTYRLPLEQVVEWLP